MPKRKIPENYRKFLARGLHKTRKQQLKVQLDFGKMKELIFRNKKIAFRKEDLSESARKKLLEFGWKIAKIDSEIIIFRMPKEKPKIYTHESIVIRELRDEDIFMLFLQGFDAFPLEFVNQYTEVRLRGAGWNETVIDNERYLVAPEELWKLEREVPRKIFKLDEETIKYLWSVRNKLKSIVDEKIERKISLEECERRLKEIIHNVLPKIGLDPNKKIFYIEDLTKEQIEALKILGFARKGKEGWGIEHKPRFVNLWYA